MTCAVPDQGGLVKSSRTLRVATQGPYGSSNYNTQSCSLDAIDA
jgi:hypothetical protein